MNDRFETSAEASLRTQHLHWQSRFDTMLHSDRAAIDIGMAAIKTIIVLNAGALAAILTFTGQLLGKGNQQTIISKTLANSAGFIWAIAFGGIALLTAYFYQSAITIRRVHELNEVSLLSSGWLPSKLFIVRFIIGAQAIMVLAGYRS